MGYFTRPFRKPYPASATRDPVEKKADALALRYFVDDLPAASVPATLLRKVLEVLQARRPAPMAALAYLQRAQLRALHDLATGVLSEDAFKAVASAEQAHRIQSAHACSAARAEEAAGREMARQASEDKMWRERDDARQRFESSPAGIARRKNQELRERFGVVGYVEEKLYPHMLDVLRRLDAGIRLSEHDVLWLNTEAREHHTPEIRAAFHANEAVHYTGLFDDTGDPWQAITASGHWRRSDKPQRALSLLERVAEVSLVTAKLRSAFATTRGGAMRDLRRFEEAITLGKTAHALLPNDCRPCTLLGAVHIELGQFVEGQRWYEMAIARGASVSVMDSDLRAIFQRADSTRRAELSTFLLEQDPVRFSWARGTMGKPRASAR